MVVQSPGVRCVSLLLVLGLVMAAYATWAKPDAGTEPSFPRGPEHRALERQVELLKAESTKPRDWHERDRADKIREDLATAERVLRRVNECHEARLLACQNYWLRLGGSRKPGDQVHPGFFTCGEKAMVTDALVRAFRRQDEVETRLKTKGLSRETRDELQQEAKELAARLDRASGLQPLFEAGALPPGLDGGFEDLPLWQPPAPPIKVQPYRPGE